MFLTESFAATAQVPEWIWHDGHATENQTCFFRKTFSCGFKPAKAELRCTADDEMSVFLNGKSVAVITNWQEPVMMEVGDRIHMGENVFTIRAKNLKSAAGVVLKLEMRTPNGSPVFVLTDKTWLCSTNEAIAVEKWRPSASLGQLGMEPWGEALGKPTATLAESLILPPGFKAELLKSAGRHEGSWICMTMDDQGRFIISPEKMEFPLLRITVSKGGEVVKTEAIAAPMRGAMGLCYGFGSLYVNGHGPKGVGLYRLTDKNHNDQFEPNEITLLKNFDGENEHGYHAVAFGPDKKLYVMNGNHTKVPPGIDLNSPHRNYQEDLLLPRLWDPNGHAKGILAPGGYVLQTDRDGKKWDLICGGFRNTYDFDFNPDGEMFTFDSDMEWDVGAPWYRPTRINHIVSGGEYGWRSGSGKWPVYDHDSLPSNLDVGLSSPTGVRFGTKSNFPKKYKDALFAADWAYGKIFAVHLQPEGASYGGTFETFISGKPLNVTHLEFGPDGAMYFIIGGWKTQSGLYRVSYVGEPDKPKMISPEETRLAQQASEQRKIRHKLESFHGQKNSAAVDQAWPYLANPDRWLRYAARVAIESQSVSGWQKRALAETNTEAALTALLALSRCGDKKLQPEILSRLQNLLVASENEAQTLELLRDFEVCFTRMGKPEAATVKRIADVLSPGFPHKSLNISRELCQLLVYLDSPDVLTKTITLLGSAPTQEEQMFYAFTLRNVTNGWTMAERKTYFMWFNKALAEYKGGNSFDKYLVNIRKEAAGRLSADDHTALAAIIDAIRPSQTAALSPRKFVREWTLGDLSSGLAAAGKGRSPAKGREIFAAAQCILCHRIGGVGGVVGPDLTGVSGRFSRRDLIDNILSPSKIISDRYQRYNIFTRDGEQTSGFIVEEDDRKIVVMVDPLNGKSVEVNKSEIQSRMVSKVSLMPEGLLNILSKDEILDLIEFLESDGLVGKALTHRR